MASNQWSNVAAAPAASTDGYVVSVDMAAAAYVLAATVPTFGARRITAIRTVVAGADTPGTLTVVGTDPEGRTQTESIVVGAHGVTVTGTKFFASVVSITGVGWVAAGAADTIVVGWNAQNAVATGGGTLHALTINTTAAQVIVIADAQGTIATLPANIAVGTHLVYDLAWAGYLRIEPAGASNITIMHTGGMPTVWNMG